MVFRVACDCYLLAVALCNGTSENLSNDTHVENVRLFLSLFQLDVKVHFIVYENCLKNMRICVYVMNTCRAVFVIQPPAHTHILT